MARGAWRATVQGVTKSRIGLNMRACDTPLYGQTAFLSFFFFFFGYVAQLAGSQFPNQGFNPILCRGSVESS